MSDLDERLRTALHEGARAIEARDVVDRVVAKRARRRVLRRVEAASAGVVVVVVALVVSLVAFAGDGTDTTKIAAPPGPSATPVVRLVTPDGQRSRSNVSFVALNENEGYIRGPLLVQGDIVTAAAYDRVGDSYTFPPSRIIRFDLRGHLRDRVDLKGEILSLAVGEGARWALTRDKEVLAPPDPEFRVKRIGPNGDVASNPVPRGEQPAGDIFAGGGAVWVPVTDGVLRFDTATGVFAGKVPFATTTDHRSVESFGKGAFATDGTVLRRLDPATNAADEATAPAPPGLEYRDIAPGSEGQAWALGADANGRTFIWEVGHADHIEMPGARSFVTVRDVIWLELSVNGQPALRRLPEPLRGNPPPTRLSTIQSANVDGDGGLVPFDSRRAIVVSHGSLFLVHLAP
jgi:hypothetical protein